MKKYFICENRTEEIEVIKEVSKKEFNTIMEYTQKLKYYNLAKLYKDIVIKNGIELEKYLTNLQQSKKVIENLRNEATGIGIESNRLMLNYLVAFRTFVDNMQMIYIKKINKDVFKANVLSKIYDSENVYSFFYQLRNYAVHYNLVFDKVIVESESIKLYGSKKHFLEYKDWNKKNNKFLEENVDNIDFCGYINKMNEIIMGIYLAYISYFADTLQEIHNNIMMIMKKYKIIRPCLMKCVVLKSKTDNFVYELGLDILKEATDELVKLGVKKINLISEKDILNVN